MDVPADGLPSPQQVGQQLVRGVRMLSREGSSQVTIQLDPPELGEVTVRLVSRDQVLSGEISVANRQVQDAVQQGLGGLREALVSQGIQVDGLEVLVDDRGASSTDRDQTNPFLRDRSGNGPEQDESNPQRHPQQRDPWPTRQGGYGQARLDLTA